MVLCREIKEACQEKSTSQIADKEKYNLIGHVCEWTKVVGDMAVKPSFCKKD